MANTRAGNVYRVDTSANFPELRNIQAIKYVGNTSATKGEAFISAATAAGDSTGNKLWDNGNTTTADITDHDLEIRASEGVYVTVGAHSAVIYIYTGDC